MAPPDDMSVEQACQQVGGYQGSGLRILLPAGDQAWGGVDPEGRGLGSSVIRYPPSGVERGPGAAIDSQIHCRWRAWHAGLTYRRTNTADPPPARHTPINAQRI